MTASTAVVMLLADSGGPTLWEATRPLLLLAVGAVAGLSGWYIKKKANKLKKKRQSETKDNLDLFGDILLLIVCVPCLLGGFGYFMDLMK